MLAEKKDREIHRMSHRLLSCCGKAFTASSEFKIELDLPAKATKSLLKTTPYTRILWQGKCPLCDKPNARQAYFNPYGDKLGNEETVKPSKVRAAMAELGEALKRAKQGAHWVLGSNHQFPYQLQQVTVK